VYKLDLGGKMDTAKPVVMFLAKDGLRDEKLNNQALANQKMAKSSK